LIQRIEETDSFSIGTETIKARVATDEKGSAKLFQILTNAYSDKEATTLQEITANAHDSYKRINKQGIVTIEYKSDDNSLHIIDEAEGISPEVFKKYIAELCASSKEGELFSAGTLGIGFYTAWCTTETFYITTVCNNIKYYYSCYKEDYQMPVFTPLTQHECNEVNGTDYWFYVTYTDKYNFQKALSKLRYFENVFVKGFNFDNNYKIIQGTSFMFSNTFPTKDDELEICFGNTPYPINWDKLGINKIKIPLALKIDLSDSLTILPSREHLKWDEYTINKVKEKIEEFKLEIFELYKKQHESSFDNILDYLKAINNKNYLELYGRSFYIRDLNYTTVNITYSKLPEGMKIPEYSDLFNEFSFKYLNGKDGYGNYLYEYQKKDFYITEKSFNPRRTKLIDNKGVSVLKYNSENLSNISYMSNYDKRKYFTDEVLNIGIPDNAIELIDNFNKIIYQDLKDKLLKYDDIIVPKKKVIKVKRNSGVIYARINNDVVKQDYNTEYLNAKYIFLTDNKEDFQEIYNYLQAYIYNKKLVLVIYTAKSNHKLFTENVITLSEWSKTDMFKSAYQRICNEVYLRKFKDTWRFRQYLENYKKELYNLASKFKTNKYISNYSNIIMLGDKMGIDKNIIKLPMLDKEYDFYETMQEKTEVYQRLYTVNRMLKNKLNKQSICKTLN